LVLIRSWILVVLSVINGSKLTLVVQKPAPLNAPKVNENGLYAEWLLSNVRTNTPNVQATGELQSVVRSTITLNAMLCQGAYRLVVSQSQPTQTIPQRARDAKAGVVEQPIRLRILPN
jgi:hypothetical protein